QLAAPSYFPTLSLHDALPIYRGAHGGRLLRLPRGGLDLVPPVLDPATGPHAHVELADLLPTARALRARDLRDLALHPARARVQRAAGLPHPPLHRVPLAGAGEGRPARLGESGLLTCQRPRPRSSLPAGRAPGSAGCAKPTSSSAGSGCSITCSPPPSSAGRGSSSATRISPCRPGCSSLGKIPPVRGPQPGSRPGWSS